jgi:Uma2 family endonuclease
MVTDYVKPKLWNRDDYLKLAELGFIGPEERTELIDGEIVQMSPQSCTHTLAIVHGTSLLSRLFDSTHYVQVQSTLDLSESFMPEPDLALIEKRLMDESEGRPGTADLLIEVSFTSLRYDQEKARLYARSNIREYWIVDLVAQCLHVFRDPQHDGYRSQQRLERSESVAPLLCPETLVPIDGLF